jgi:hypothetical protein
MCQERGQFEWLRRAHHRQWLTDTASCESLRAVIYTSLMAMLAASSVDDHSRLGRQPRPDPDLGLCHGMAAVFTAIGEHRRAPYLGHATLGRAPGLPYGAELPEAAETTGGTHSRFRPRFSW